MGVRSARRPDHRSHVIATGHQVMSHIAEIEIDDAHLDVYKALLAEEQESGPGTADRRGPGHLSDRDDDAVGAGARVVRGYSFVGDFFVYVLFDDGTDLYWARSRVLEYLSQVQSRLPEGAKASLGPDATGVGWIYEYALVDRTGRHDLAQLRSVQDWFLRYELKAVPGVAEVASIGGMVRQYQVILDPQKLASYGITHGDCQEFCARGHMMDEKDHRYGDRQGYAGPSACGA